MSEIFFIADTHFGHKNILKFSATSPFRPFSSIEEHDAELVRRWNNVVSKKDKVFHLGDFCFGKRNLQIARELNGNKVLILGNHDRYESEDYLRYFSKLYGACEYKGFLLTHIPVYPEQLNRWKANIHGHLHTHNVEDIRYFCVSCEQINLTPIALDQLLDKLSYQFNREDK